MNNWYECKVRYEKMTDSGTIKKANESYLIDAYSVTEAEARLVEELTPFTSHGEFMLSSVKKEKIAELFLSEDETDDKYYRCKVNFISLDEKKGIEKKMPAIMIVKADTLPRAVARLEKEMGEGLTNYQISTVAETNIMDVLVAPITSSKDKA